MIQTQANTKRRWGFILAAFFVMMGLGLPPLPGWEAAGMAVVGLFLGMLVLWLTQALDWPCLLGLVGLACCPGLGPKWVFKQGFGDPTVAFLIFTFACTYALSKTTFIQRVALRFLRSHWASRSSRHFLVAYLAAVGLLGLVFSPTVLFMIFAAFYRELIARLDLSPGDRLGEQLMIGQVIVCALTSGMTPVAHVFPILALGFAESLLGVTVSWGQYLALSLPVGLVVFAGLLVVGTRRLPRGQAMTPGRAGDTGVQWDELAIAGGFSPREKWIMGVFLAVVLGWVLPGFLPGLKAVSALGPAFPPLVGTLLLLGIRHKGVALLSLNEVAQKGVAWTSVLMAATTLAFGGALTEPSLGIETALKGALGTLTQALTPALLILAVLIWTGLQTNVASNIVTVTLVSLVVLPLVQAAVPGISPVYFTVAIGFLSSCSFMTPAAHPNVAIAISERWVRPSRQLSAGALALMGVIGAFWLIGLVWLHGG